MTLTPTLVVTFSDNARSRISEASVSERRPKPEAAGRETLTTNKNGAVLSEIVGKVVNY